MIELLSPEMLFNKQRVFHLNDSVKSTVSTTGNCKVVVVFNLPSETLQPALQEMLDKLILACKFSAAETAYVNTHFMPEITLGTLQNEYNPQAVLVFGDVSISRNLTKLKKNFAYELNGIKIVNTDSLETLLKNGEAKKVLWGVLKRMLGI